MDRSYLVTKLEEKKVVEERHAKKEVENIVVLLKNY